MQAASGKEVDWNEATDMGAAVMMVVPVGAVGSSTVKAGVRGLAAKETEQLAAKAASEADAAVMKVVAKEMADYPDLIPGTLVKAGELAPQTLGKTISNWMGFGKSFSKTITIDTKQIGPLAVETGKDVLKYVATHEVDHKAMMESTVFWERYFPGINVQARNWIVNNKQFGTWVNEAFTDIATTIKYPENFNVLLGMKRTTGPFQVTNTAINVLKGVGESSGSKSLQQASNALKQVADKIKSGGGILPALAPFAPAALNSVPQPSPTNSSTVKSHESLLKGNLWSVPTKPASNTCSILSKPAPTPVSNAKPQTSSLNSNPWGNLAKPAPKPTTNSTCSAPVKSTPAKSAPSGGRK
jgi:hypothetical protein